MLPTKYPSSVNTVRQTLFPCLHVVSNLVNVPSDEESGSHTDSRIEVIGCLASSVVKMEQIHPDLSLHTEMCMSEQMAISTDRMMISFFISSSMNRSGQDDLIRLDYRRLSVFSFAVQIQVSLLLHRNFGSHRLRQYHFHAPSTRYGVIWRIASAQIPVADILFHHSHR